MKSAKTIKELFSFTGFSVNARLTGVFGDQYARVVTLSRRKKQPSVPIVGTSVEVGTTNRSNVFATYRWPVTEYIWILNVGGLNARGAKACM